MRNLSKLSLIGITAIALTFFNPLTLDWQTGLSRQGLVQGDRAEAKSSSGGRSRGGSFSGGSSSGSSSSGSSSRSRSSGASSSSESSSFSSPSRSSGSSSSDRPRRSDPVPNSRPAYGYSSGGYSTGYSSGYSSGSTSSSGDGVWLTLIVVGGVIGAIAYLIWKVKSSIGTDEKGNDIVTITQLQVALLAQERDIQNRLSELTLSADMETPEGRSEMLKESVLALLRSPENWSHVYSQAQTVKDRESAGQVFEQISMTERSKVEAETLVNVGGKVRHQALKSEDSDPGSYIIVTLLIGTEHDKPLFEKVQTNEDLKTALQNLGAISMEDLLILELLWNPQDSKESLTYDEMLEAYPELGAIA